VEANLEHLLDVLRESPLDSVEAEAESAEDTELLFLGIPARSVVGLPHLGHPIAEPGGRVLDPEVAGHPGHIDVAIRGDDAIAHGLTSLESETVSVRTFTPWPAGRVAPPNDTGQDDRRMCGSPQDGFGYVGAGARMAISRPAPY